MPAECQCRWLRYTPKASKHGESLKTWTCLICSAEFDVIAIRKRMLDGQDVNELTLVTAAQGD